MERQQRRWGGGLSGTEGGGWAGAGRGPVPGVFFISKNVLGAKVAQFTRIDLDESPERPLLGLGNVSFLQRCF